MRWDGRDIGGHVVEVRFGQVVVISWILLSNSGLQALLDRFLGFPSLLIAPGALLHDS